MSDPQRKRLDVTDLPEPRTDNPAHRPTGVPPSPPQTRDGPWSILLQERTSTSCPERVLRLQQLELPGYRGKGLRQRSGSRARAPAAAPPELTFLEMRRVVRPQSAGPEAEQLPGVPRPLCSRAGSHHSCSPGRPSPGRMSGWMSGQMHGWKDG